MKIVSIVLFALASLTLLGCPEDKPAAGSKPASTAASNAKPASSAAPASTGGW